MSANRQLELFDFWPRRPGNSGEQRLCVGVQRIFIEIFLSRPLDDLPQVHYRHLTQELSETIIV